MREKFGDGGKCSLHDAVQLMHKIFETNRMAGELAIQLLKPEDIEQFDYIVFNVCYKMAKLGESAERLFKFIDENGDGTIDEDEFVLRIREDLGLWLPDSDLFQVFKKVDIDGSGVLDKREFLKVLNLDTFFKKKESSQYVSTKREIIDAVISTFDDI